MNCFTHSQRPAVGMCAICQRGLCHDCVGAETPRLLCQSCAARSRMPPAMLGGGFYGFGYEYKSSVAIGGWPLLHIAGGYDPVTLRPRIARGVIAIGNIAIGGLAVGGVACGLITLGGASIGVLAAVGGAALGLGLSIGGLAVGSIAIGGAAVGFVYAIGGAATAPAVIDATHCDEAVAEFARRWLGTTVTICR
jgi:hypothetical protein